MARLFARFRRQFRRIPAFNALGHVLDVRVAQFLGRHRRLRIGGAVRVAAIGDDERALVRRQAGGEVALDGRPAQRARHMAGLVGIRAVRVNDHRRLGGGGREDVLGADVGKFTGADRGGDKRRRHECKEFFHVSYIFGWLMVNRSEL